MEETQEALVEKESGEFARLLSEFQVQAKDLKERLVPLLRKVKSGEMKTSGGVSFLELKHSLLLQYCLDATFYLALKTSGQSVKDHPVVSELVRLRVIIERLRPIEKKLRYQLDKLLKSNPDDQDTNAGDGDPLAHRPALADFKEGAEEDEDGKDKAEAAGGVYRPPRIREVEYEGTTKAEKEREREKRKAERRAKGAIASFVREEYGEAPVERKVVGKGMRDGEDSEAEDEQAEEAASLRRRRMEREKFEEENFSRVDTGREEKQAERRRMRGAAKFVDELQGLERFADSARLGGRRRGREQQEEEEDDDDDEFETPLAKRAKGSAGDEDDFGEDDSLIGELDEEEEEGPEGGEDKGKRGGPRKMPSTKPSGRGRKSFRGGPARKPAKPVRRGRR